METEKLIEEVRKYPVLYDQGNEKYRNVDYKERVWRMISEKLKAPGGQQECRKRWASIRDQCCRTLQKRKTKSGQATAKIQKYKYDEILEFLLPYIGERETLSNVPSMNHQRNYFEFDLRVEELENYVESELETQHEVWQYRGFSSQTTVLPTSLVNSAESTQATSEKDNYSQRSMNVRRSGSSHEKPAQESSSSQLMAFILAEKEAEKKKQFNATNPQQHHVDSFLASFAPVLKSLDRVLLNQAKTVIFNTVQEFELKQISKNESHQHIRTPLRSDTINHALFSSVTGTNGLFSNSPLTNELTICNSANESQQL